MFLYSNGANLRILYYKQFLDDRRIAGLIWVTCALWVLYVTVSEVKNIFFRILELCVQFWTHILRFLK